jgi:hypothetical protein
VLYSTSLLAGALPTVNDTSALFEQSFTTTKKLNPTGDRLTLVITTQDAGYADITHTCQLPSGKALAAGTHTFRSYYNNGYWSEDFRYWGGLVGYEYQLVPATGNLTLDLIDPDPPGASVKVYRDDTWQEAAAKIWRDDAWRDASVKAAKSGVWE